MSDPKIKWPSLNAIEYGLLVAIVCVVVLGLINMVYPS